MDNWPAGTGPGDPGQSLSMGISGSSWTTTPHGMASSRCTPGGSKQEILESYRQGRLDQPGKGMILQKGRGGRQGRHGQRVEPRVCPPKLPWR